MKDLNGSEDLNAKLGGVIKTAVWGSVLLSLWNCFYLNAVGAFKYSLSYRLKFDAVINT